MIAILSSDFLQTLEWARKEFKVDTVSVSRKFLKTKDGKEYMIVNAPEQAYGFNFESYIKAPDYHTLEDVVKNRVINAR